MGGISTLLPRAYQENISFDFTKVALNDIESWRVTLIELIGVVELSRVQFGL